MTPANLKLLGHTSEEQEQEQKKLLADDLQEIISKTREDTIVRVREWVTYYAKQGRRRLFLDEGPYILPGDVSFILEWMREQGLEVSVPKLSWFGRVTIELP